MQPVKFQESRVGRVGRVGLVTCLVALHRICFDETHFSGKWWLLSVSPSVPNSSTLFHVVPFVLCHSVYFAESFLMKPEVLSIKGLMPENIRELLGLGCFSPFSFPGAWCFSGCFRGISMLAFPWAVVACAQRSSLKLRTVLTIMDSNMTIQLLSPKILQRESQDGIWRFLTTKHQKRDSLQGSAGAVCKPEPCAQGLGAGAATVAALVWTPAVFCASEDVSRGG